MSSQKIDEIAAILIDIKAMVESAGVPTMKVSQYLNMGREIYGRSREDLSGRGNIVRKDLRRDNRKII